MKNKQTRKKKHCGGTARYEMLTVFCYIALNSPESAAKRVVLMKTMTDALARARGQSSTSSCQPLF